MKLPADWHRATDRAPDRVSLMADILLAVGTSPIRPRPGAACSDAADEPRVETRSETLAVLNSLRPLEHQR